MKLASTQVLLVSIVLTVLLAISNTFLALKVGMLTAASIPAAMLSMGFLRFSKSATLQDHNLIQTAASSGEAIAGGIGYSLPALIMVGFSQNFDYLTCFLIALTGGLLGVFFSTFIRSTLMQDPSLKFPEAMAITQVLNLSVTASNEKNQPGEKKTLGVMQMLFGMILGGFIETLQSIHAMFSGTFKFFVPHRTLFALGISFSPALIGAGYIVGLNTGISLLIGTLFSYGFALPFLSFGKVTTGENYSQLLNQNWSMDLRYIGVGAMLSAAFITLVQVAGPLCQYFCRSFRHLRKDDAENFPLSARLSAIALCFVVLCWLFYHLFFPLILNAHTTVIFTGAALGFVLILGMLATLVTGYFSGLVGVSASPGSSVLIATLLICASILGSLSNTYHLSLFSGEVITLIVSSVVMQIACIANDTVQDLKVGHLLRTSQKQQQLMLIFGVVVAALVVPWVMQILYTVHGFVGHLPRTNMNPANALAAPPAAIMTALTESMFNQKIPRSDLWIGALFIGLLWLLQKIDRKHFSRISLIAVGIGMYLGLLISTPMILGAAISGIVQYQCRRTPEISQKRSYQKTLLGCGLLTGATLIDVLLAIPIALHPSGEAFTIKVSPLIYGDLSFVGIFVLLFALLKKTNASSELL